MFFFHVCILRRTSHKPLRHKHALYKETLLKLVLLFAVSFANVGHGIYSSIREDFLTEECRGNRKWNFNDLQHLHVVLCTAGRSSIQSPGLGGIGIPGINVLNWKDVFLGF